MFVVVSVVLSKTKIETRHGAFVGHYTTLVKHYSSVIQKGFLWFLCILKPIQKQCHSL